MTVAYKRSQLAKLASRPFLLHRLGYRLISALNLPRALHVEESNSQPIRIHTSSGQMEIESIRERWRIDDEWWRRPVSRIYYQVLLASGDQLTIFKDLETGQWFQQQY